MKTDKSVDYSQLFELGEPGASRPLRLAPREQKWINDDTVWRLFTGEWQPSESLILKGVMGGMPADFLWTTFPPLVCISNRVVGLLLEGCFTGWATYPVQVYDRKGQPLPSYHGLAVKSWAGDRDISRSEIIHKPPIVPGGVPYDVFKGIFFDDSKWDGSDVFRVDAGYIVVTGRVREAFKRARVTNVRFRPLAEIERSVNIFLPGNPGNMK